MDDMEAQLSEYLAERDEERAIAYEWGLRYWLLEESADSWAD